MKKNIEDIIREKTTSFDSEVPSEGHFERFAKQLESRGQKKNQNQFLYWTLCTAAVLLLFINILPFVRSEPTLQPDPISETVAYYNGKINIAIEAIEPLLKNLDDSTRHDLTTVLQTMQTECEKFAITPPITKKDNYLAAIRTHYDAKLTSLQHIQHILKSIRHSQNEYNM